MYLLALLIRLGSLDLDEDLLDHALLQYFLLVRLIVLVEVQGQVLCLQLSFDVVLDVEKHGHLRVLADLQRSTEMGS